ncbi:MAG: hypothetical protein ACKPKO_61865, partial [Candidatus Fonsibacter sp.]
MSTARAALPTPSSKRPRLARNRWEAEAGCVASSAAEEAMKRSATGRSQTRTKAKAKHHKAHPEGHGEDADK